MQALNAKIWARLSNAHVHNCFTLQLAIETIYDDQWYNYNYTSVMLCLLLLFFSAPSCLSPPLSTSYLLVSLPFLPPSLPLPSLSPSLPLSQVSTTITTVEYTTAEYTTAEYTTEYTTVEYTTTEYTTGSTTVMVCLSDGIVHTSWASCGGGGDASALAQGLSSGQLPLLPPVSGGREGKEGGAMQFVVCSSRMCVCVLQACIRRG